MPDMASRIAAVESMMQMVRSMPQSSSSEVQLGLLGFQMKTLGYEQKKRNEGKWVFPDEPELPPPPAEAWPPVWPEGPAETWDDLSGRAALLKKITQKFLSSRIRIGGGE
jgi:hypothetical protein